MRDAQLREKGLQEIYPDSPKYPDSGMDWNVRSPRALAGDVLQFRRQM